MTARGVWIIGAGKRVLDTALPAFLRARAEWSIRGVFARRAREVQGGGAAFAVEESAQMSASRLRDVDLVYVAVGKSALPIVLDALARLDPRNVDLLIDTPVLLPKQFRHAAKFAAFRHAWVAEDCIELPWYETIRRARERGMLGALRDARFERSAYRYHAFAMVKALFESDRIDGAQRTRAGGDETRTLTLSGGRSAVIVEPRDYARGSFVLRGEIATVTDDATATGMLHLTTRGPANALAGFQLGDVTTDLDDDERALLALAPTPRVTGRMEDWKRIGFLRLLRRLHAGTGAYPIEQGLDDSFLDFRLDKFGSARAGGLTDPRAGAGRVLWNTISRLVRG